jgi:phosphoglycerate dehydrogenase-like enzyme
MARERAAREVAVTRRYNVGLPGSLFRKDGSANFPAYDLSALAEEQHVDVSYFESASPIAADLIANYDSIVLLGERMTAESFPVDGRLLHIARMGVGYDTVDVDACTANDVVLTITPDAVRRPMAVATLAFLLALAGNMFVKDRLTRQGPAGWQARTHHHGTGLTGRTLGIVGLGNIGADIVRVAGPLDMRIIAHDPYIEPGRARALGVELVALDELFRTADFISLNCPLTDETRHLVDDRRLGLMKPTAYLINTARGPVVDQAALYRALAERRIAGAGIDVMDPEPSAVDEPLHSLDNVILAPHALGWTDEMFATMAKVNMAAMRALMAGRAPDNVVNPDVLNRPGFQAKLQDAKIG